MPVTEQEMLSLRTEVQTWYEDSVTIIRRTIAEDAFGGEDETAETMIATGVKCFVESSPGREQLTPFLANLAEEHLFIIYLPAEQDVKLGDFLVLTSQGSIELRVQAVLAPESLDIELMVAASTLGER